MTPAVDRTRMARLVQDENVLLRDFVALLGQEQALLLEGDVDALEVVLPRAANDDLVAGHVRKNFNRVFRPRGRQANSVL